MDDYLSITLTAVRRAFEGDAEALWIARMLVGHLGAVTPARMLSVDQTTRVLPAS